MTAAALVVGATYRERATGRIVRYMGVEVIAGDVKYRFYDAVIRGERYIDPADVDAV